MTLQFSLASEIAEIAEWPSVALGEVVDILDSRRKPITKRDRVAGPYPYYGATGILDWVEGYILDEPLVLIGEDGAKWGAGEASAFPVSGKVWVNNHAHVMRPDRESLLDEWLIYYLNAADLSEFISGMTVPKLNQGRLKEIPIPIPPLEEQKRIVTVLDQAFAALDRARANAEANLADAEELFEAQLDAIFGRSNAGWTSDKLASLCSKIGSGATPKGGAASYKSEGISLIRSLNVYDRDFCEEKLAFLDDGQAAKLANVEVEADDVLFNITGASVARCCIAPKEHLPARVNQHVSILRPDRTRLQPEFLCYLLTARTMKDRLLKVGSEGGATRQAITKAQLEALEVAFPKGVTQQAAIVGGLKARSEKCAALSCAYRQTIEDVHNLRQSILQKAFAGELT